MNDENGKPSQVELKQLAQHMFDKADSPIDQIRCKEIFKLCVYRDVTTNESEKGQRGANPKAKSYRRHKFLS